MLMEGRRRPPNSADSSLGPAHETFFLQPLCRTQRCLHQALPVPPVEWRRCPPTQLAFVCLPSRGRPRSVQIGGRWGSGRTNRRDAWVPDLITVPCALDPCYSGA